MRNWLHYYNPMKKSPHKLNDRKLAALMRREEKRQAETLDLIPSENFASPAIRMLSGSVLMNKYSEGYPGMRYYPGNTVVDEIENLAIARGKRAFHLGPDWHLNVQPYSGSPANIAVYWGLLKFGETLMGMELAAGGHLTHGHRVNFSGISYRSVPYGVDSETGLIDYEKVETLAKRVRPKLIVSGITAYPRRVDFKRFGKIAKKVGALHMADISHIAGLVAAGLHPSPFPHADVVTTTTHKTLRGPRGAVIFSRGKLHEAIDRAVFPGLQGGPHDNTIAAIAYAFGAAAAPSFKKYAATVIENAGVLARELQARGFALVTGGTDNHLMLIDLKNMGMDGKEAESLLERAGIIANRNSIPGDRTPFRPSGLRLGTPAITTRGLKPRDMARIADWTLRVVKLRQRPETIRREVGLFLKRYPLA